MSSTGFVKKAGYLAVIGLLTSMSIAQAASEAIPSNNSNVVKTDADGAIASSSALAATDPMALANKWLQKANDAGDAPRYMVMGTMKHEHPSIKIITMGEFTPAGYVFKLNESSHTSQEVKQLSDVSMLISWNEKSSGDQARQIRFYGKIVPQDAVETHSITYQGQPLEYKSRTYVLKPEGAQFSVINFVASDKSGVSEYINYTLTNGAWTKQPIKTLAFDTKS